MASKQQGPVQKQKATVYTMMLISSFLALLIACMLLYFELKKYDFDYHAKEYKGGHILQPAAVEIWSQPKPLTLTA